MHTLPQIDQTERFREFLASEGYTRAGLLDQAQTIESPPPQQRSLPRLLYLTEAPTRLNRLIRWFLGGVPVATDEAERLFPKWFIELGLSTGILFPQGDYLASGTVIEPFANLLIASDTYRHLASASSYDHVLALGPTAQFLLNVTIRRPVSATLDLGTGSGIQALLAASHSDRVVATDINARAILFTRFNAALNGLGNIECLVGDLLTPVDGRQFDLIVSNPPFVLAPSKEFVYRDSGFALDGLCSSLVRQSPSYLVEGGMFQLLCDSVEVRGQNWQDRIAEWFLESGCDVLVLKQSSLTPVNYAQMRLAETLHVSEEADNTAFRQWLDYYESHDVEAIHSVFITMRKRAGHRNWLVFEDVSADITRPFGSTIEERFRAQDVIVTQDGDEPLMRSRLRLADGLQLQHRQERHDGAWETVELRLLQVGNPRRQLDVDASIAEFLARLDGSRTLAELIAEIVDRVGIDPEDVRRQVTTVVTRLLQRGFLIVN